jgi:tripartite-type tricarboxylate transporter receptor subunit TctC
MIKKGKEILILITLIVLIMTSGLAVGAQKEEAWPTKPITMLIPYTAGGTSDIVARALAREMQTYLKMNISCVNVLGAAGSVAGRQVFAAPSDGYTILGGNAHLPAGWRVLKYADLSWRDFYGFHAGTSPYVFFVSSKSKWQKYEDFIQSMKDKPGELKWGSSGLGSINHVTGELVLDSIGVKAKHIPYGGGREAAIKVIAGDIDFSWAGLSDVSDLVRSGQLRVLAVASENDLKVAGKASYMAPSLSKMDPRLKFAEDLMYWGIRVKRDTPAPIVNKIRDAFDFAVKQKRFIDFCESRDLFVSVTSGEKDDRLCARVEAIYAWGVVDAGIAKDLTPANFQIPRIKDFKWPDASVAKLRPWPSR